jgi:uncharacterized membrane protein YbhN (UPF0104 family)
VTEPSLPAVRDTLLQRTYRRAKPWLATVLTLALLGVLVWQLRMVDWAQVASAVRAYPVQVIGWATALTVASHLVYCCFDLLGRAYTGHRLPAREVLRAAFVSYGFGLNLGFAGVGFRYRVYHRLGLSAGLITRLWGVCIATNWLGYFVLAGALFLSGLIVLPARWGFGGDAMRTLGALLLAGAAVYLAVCARAGRKGWTWRRQRVAVPTLRFAMGQSALGALNWLLMGGVIFVLLRQQVPYELVLGVLLASALVHAVADVPGGMGVTEAVFVGLLGGRMPMAELVAGLVAFRALYYLVPMVPAGLTYLAFEAAPVRSAAR